MEASARPAGPVAGRHVLYGLLSLVALPWLWGAWLDFSFVLAGRGPPDDTDWDSDKHATVGLAIVFGPFWSAATLGALGLFIHLWKRAPELRWRVAMWIGLLVECGLAGYDWRRPGAAWQVQGVAALLVAVVATTLPVVWSLLLLRRQLAR